MLFHVRALVVAMFFLCLPSLVVAAEMKDPYSYANLDQVRVTRYTLDLTVDKKPLDGQEAVTFERMRATLDIEAVGKKRPQTIRLDAVDMQIDGVTFAPNNQKASWGWYYKKEKGKKKPTGLIIFVPKSMQKQKSWTVEIDYRMQKRGKGGLFTGLSNKTKQPFVFTQLEYIGARRVFPSQDSPLVRSQFVTHFNVASKDLQAWATGEREETTDNKLTFSSESPIPTYLYAFVVGRFNELEDRGFSVIAEVGGRELKKRTKRVVDSFVDSKKYYEKTLNYKLPYKRMRVFLAPDAFPWGGMENQAFVFLASALSTDDGLALRSELIPHELVHHWFGNLITLKDWSDYSVNEAPTNYLEARYTEAKEGKNKAAASWLGLLESTAQKSYNKKRDPRAGRLTTYWNPDEEQQNFTDYYNKGSWILREAEYFVGQQTMDKALASMLTKGYRNLSTRGFFTELGNLLEKESQQTTTKARTVELPRNGLAKHLVSLADKPGMPMIEVSCFDQNGDGNLDVMKLKQDRRQLYDLGTVNITSYGKRATIHEVVFDRAGKATVNFANTEGSSTNSSVQAAFVDATARRWIDTNHCFDKTSKQAVDAAAASVTAEAVRVQNTLVQALGIELFQRMYEVRGATKRAELKRYPLEFALGLKLATAKKPMQTLRKWLKKSIKKKDYLRAQEIIKLAAKLGLKEEHAIVADLKEIATDDSYTVLRAVAGGAIGTLPSEQDFLIGLLVDQMQFNAFTVTRMFLSGWLEGGKSAARGNREVQKRLAALAKEGDIKNANVKQRLTYWLKEQ